MTASLSLSVEETARRRLLLDDAYVDLFAALPKSVTEHLGIGAMRIGSAGLSVLRSVPIPLFNRVVNLGVQTPATPAQVDAITAVYREDGIPFMVQLSPLAMPGALPEWLEARGVRRKDSWAIFTRDVAAPPEVPTDLRVERIGQDLAEVFGETLARGYGLPPALRSLMSVLVGLPGMHSYLAFDGDVPVAAASMFVQRDTARLTGAGTLQEHRRRGAQGALLTRRIRDAAALGCDLLTVETAEDPPERPNPSFHNMLRCGFQLAYLQPNFVYSPA